MLRLGKHCPVRSLACRSRSREPIGRDPGVVEMALNPVRAGAREVALIVVGILIAFALDAAWDNRSRRIAESALLSSLRSETEHNLRELAQEDASRAIALDAARELFARAGPIAQPEPYVELEAQLLQIAEGANTYEARTGTINSIVQAGKLDLIRSDSLRMAIASWQEQLRDVREEEDRSIQYLLDRFWTYLEGRVVLPTNGSGWEGSFDSATSASLLRDPVFAKHVAQQMHRIRMTLDDAADLRVLMERMLRLIDQELDWSQS
jgi:hypothetical protein